MRKKSREEFNQKLIDKAAYWKYVMQHVPSAKAAMHLARLVQRISSYEKIGKFKAKYKTKRTS